MGCVACSLACYRMFREFFDVVLRDAHGGYDLHMLADEEHERVEEEGEQSAATAATPPPLADKDNDKAIRGGTAGRDGASSLTPTRLRWRTRWRQRMYVNMTA